MAKTKEKTTTEPVIDSERTVTLMETIDVSVLTMEDKKELYTIWLSIPAMLRLLPEKDQLQMGYDVHDPVWSVLLPIRTKQNFCTFFKVGINQPAFWERKDPALFDRAMEISKRQNVIRFKKDVDFSFTQKVLKFGDANRMKLWKQVFEGWTEKTESHNTNVNITPVGLVKMLQELEANNAKLRADHAKARKEAK